MTTILLTDGFMRKTLSAARSLGEQGAKVIVSDTTSCTPAAYSKYCSLSLTYPDPVREPQKFFGWLKAAVRRHAVDVLMPMDDAVLSLVIAHEEELPATCACVLPPADAYHIASDKHLSLRLAASAGLPTPRTVLPRSANEVDKLAGMLQYPVIIKPRSSSGSRGIRLASDADELKREYALVHREYPFPMIQERIPTGERIDVCLLFNLESELRASFVQRELRHFPLERGPSTAQESIWLPELAARCEAMLKKLGWQGIAEVEFMVDPRDGLPKFMEINPRFWDSLHLSKLAGINFPWMLSRIALGDDVPAVRDYAVGVRCRNGLPGDLLHFLWNENRFRMLPSYLGVGENGGDDILSLKDPGPAFGFLLACARRSFDRNRRKSVFDR